MDVYVLRAINVKVGEDGEFSTFEEVIDWLLSDKSKPYGYGFTRGLQMLGMDNIAELSEALVDKHGCFSEDAAMDLCMDSLDGVSLDDDDFKAEWEDQMYSRAAGK